MIEILSLFTINFSEGNATARNVGRYMYDIDRKADATMKST
jgi:hypothetical protein